MIIYKSTLDKQKQKILYEDSYTVVLYDYFTGEEKYRNPSTSRFSAIITCEHWIENLKVANDLYYASPDESIIITMKDKLLREFRIDREDCPYCFGVSSVCRVYNNEYYN